MQQIDRLKGETPTKGIVAPVGLAASDALQAAKDGLSRFLHGIGTSGR